MSRNEIVEIETEVAAAAAVVVVVAYPALVLAAPHILPLHNNTSASHALHVLRAAQG